MTTAGSKFLSYVLRHRPESIGLVLDKQGWADVTELLAKTNATGTELTLDQLKFIVETNDKQRFVFSDDASRIRAAQGHSIDVDLKLKVRPLRQSCTTARLANLLGQFASRACCQ